MNKNPSPPTRFKPGQTGNAKGRPKGSLSITTLIKKQLEIIPEGSKESYAELLVRKLINQAVLSGDVVSQKLIWSYVDGTPKQIHEDPENQPANIIIHKIVADQH